MSELYQWLIEQATSLQALPWLFLSLIALPLFLVSYRRIYPHTPMLILLLAPCLFSIALAFRSELLLIVTILDLGVISVALIDVFTLPNKNTFTFDRKLTRVASLNVEHDVELTVANQTGLSYYASIRDDLPEEFKGEPEELVARIPSRSRAILNYQFTAKRRGAFKLDSVHVRVTSRFGLWRRYLLFPVESIVHVYPDMNQLSKYAILARTNRLSLLGVRRTRKIGQDNEFERLRDYTPDDNYKHIDWRSTARRNKLTVKDYQTSQSQRIIFMLDCGRMMTNESSGLSLLDHSLNAMLMLSFVALRQGDSVGLICFSDEIHNYIPPRGGMNQMNHLLHAGFDRFPKRVESRYDQAFLYLGSRCKKRSLVVLVSNLIDEVNSHQLEQYLSQLVGRHLPLGVLLRDHRLFDAVEDRSNMYRAAAAAEILTWRHQVLTDLEHKGVLSLDVFPEDMTAPLINQYLEIKARHLL